MPDLTRVRPWDLLEVKEKYGDMLLSAAIAAIHTEGGRIHNCPKCVPDTIEVDPQPTGRITITVSGNTTEQITCDICNGFLKTVTQYVEDEENPGAYIPIVTEPEQEEPESQEPE
jgi:hypothetical protein